MYLVALEYCSSENQIVMSLMYNILLCYQAGKFETLQRLNDETFTYKPL